MRLHAGLPLNMWEEAINTIVYLINRAPYTCLGFGITKEAWNGKKVSYSFLKTYDINKFGYRLWDFENFKIIRSRDVIFNEKVFIKSIVAV